VAQGLELLNVIGQSPVPVVIGGDFNSAAPGGRGRDLTATYSNFLAAGLLDTWAVAHPGVSGLTWPLHLEDDFGFSVPTERIDLVFATRTIGVAAVQRIGATTSDLTPSGLWPSDHAGVVATLQIPNPSGGRIR
jgi:endonuclease/exonuclease/phosphatase family metal-dependent hydrolase